MTMIDQTTTRIINARAAELGITPTEFVAPYLSDIRIRHARLHGNETPEQVEDIVAALEARGAAATKRPTNHTSEIQRNGTAPIPEAPIDEEVEA